MKALYITSVEPYSGKTAVCLSLGRHLQAEGYKVGYLKPVSTQPWRTPEGNLADEDAVFVHSVLGLEGDPTQVSPVIITPSSFRQHLKGLSEDDLMGKIQSAAEAVGKGKDIIILEGAASLRSGYAMGLSNLRVAEVLGAPVLVIVSYRSEIMHAPFLKRKALRSMVRCQASHEFQPLAWGNLPIYCKLRC